MQSQNNTDQRRQELLALIAQQSKTRTALTKNSYQLDISNEVKPSFNIRDFSSYPEIKAFEQQKAIIEKMGVDNPYFRVNQGVTTNHTWIDGKELISFSGYNYLGFSGNHYVSENAKKAIDKYGTSPSASRLVAGEKPVHVELEQALSEFIGTEASLVFASGHATNVTLIGHFFNSQDLIIYDEFSHNSLLQGCLLSGARRIAFKHNDIEHCERIIAANINKYQKIVIALEGAYSMDGDIAPLEEFVRLRRQYPILLYVDEAHSLGTIGKTGRGIREYAGIDINEIDFWMGTLSKSLASNGGYVAGKKALIDYLKYTTPGFVYAAGISPANAAAALASLELLQASNQRVLQLQENANFFRTFAKSLNMNIGSSRDTPIVPIVLGDSELAIRIADQLFQEGINVHPMFHPAVPMGEARLRFFINSEHTREDMVYTLNTLALSL